MRHGLPDETIEQLRAAFPRSAIPELISRIAAFEQVCWASASYLGRQIGRHPRTIFRYFARLRREGVLHRRYGDRAFDAIPAVAKKPYVLHAQGYALTGFGGWLEPVVRQGLARLEGHRRRANRARAKERKEERRRQRRREASVRRDQAGYDQRFPALAKKAKPANPATEASRAVEVELPAPTRPVPARDRSPP